jgi:hypothetical protein
MICLGGGGGFLPIKMMCRHIGFGLFVALRPGWHGFFQYKALRDLKKKGFKIN